MRENEEDFKPFIEDNYENFLQNLQTLGEFGGNEVQKFLLKVRFLYYYFRPW